MQENNVFPKDQKKLISTRVKMTNSEFALFDRRPKRKLAAILAADVVGFSKMMGENEDRTLCNLKACREITDGAIREHHGRVFGTAGDSIIAEFASPVDAILAAVDFQKKIYVIET